MFEMPPVGKKKESENHDGQNDQHIESGNAHENNVDQELTQEQLEIIERLEKAKNSQERVRTFAKLTDKYGLDAIVSLIPELGDAGSSVVSGIYLVFEAKKAGLQGSDYLKIIGLQAADFFIGAVPLAGDAADYLFKANKISSKLFAKKVEEIKEEAKNAGIPEEEIARIDQEAGRLPKMVEGVVHAYKKSDKPAAA